MEISVPVVVATISQSLATFIKQELAETNTAVHLLTDPDLFFKKLKGIKPELILLDASYPTGEKSSSLAKTLQQELAWQDIPLVVIKTFFEPLDESFPEISTENILTQPFTRADLLTILQRVAPQAINNHRQDQDMPMNEESVKIETTEGAASQPGNIIELTDIVEEGLPLDQLPSTERETDAGPETMTEPAIGMPTDTKKDELDFLSDEAIDGLDFMPAGTMETQSEEESLDNKPLIDETVDSEKSEAPPEESSEVNQATMDKTLEIEPADIPTEDLNLEAEMMAAADEMFIPEIPEDYLVPDEDELSEPTESESLPPPLAATATPVAQQEEQTARPSVVTESQTADFSHQIEGLTQEWSKKMLVSTYASMDKLIQALGDMAPTIVEQVAREIIPPLAEKIIKSEIQRLEEKIEDDHT
ncbi:MAG: hypothetical protein GWP07_06765 [Xanthomonadaceae bacterium]|nr:hypothetical protein [Xanthomonadaceae bacterium]